MHPIELRDAVDDVRNGVAELFNDLFERHGGVFDGVVHERRGNRNVVQTKFGDHLCDCERMRDVALPRLSTLFTMRGRCEAIGALNPIDRAARTCLAIGSDDRRELTLDADRMAPPGKNTCHRCHVSAHLHHCCVWYVAQSCSARQTNEFDQHADTNDNSTSPIDK